MTDRTGQDHVRVHVSCSVPSYYSLCIACNWRTSRALMTRSSFEGDGRWWRACAARGICA